MSRNSWSLNWILLLTLTLSPLAHAQSPSGDDTPQRDSPYRFRTLFKDIEDYALAPLHWDTEEWVYAGGAVAAIAAAHGFDETVRRHFTLGATTSSLNGKDPHSLSDALPAAVVVGGTFFYAWNIDNDAGRSETWAMLEAAGLGSGTAYALKFAAGREGPNDTVNDNHWRKGGSSFPSLHVTFATAIGTVLAEDGGDEYRWLRRTLGYGMAAGTAYLRLKHDQHWLSDTVAGAAIGGASGRFALDRDPSTARNWTLGVSPVSGGAVVSYAARF
jgi:hypothetical protein